VGGWDSVVLSVGVAASMLKDAMTAVGVALAAWIAVAILVSVEGSGRGSVTPLPLFSLATASFLVTSTFGISLSLLAAASA